MNKSQRQKNILNRKPVFAISPAKLKQQFKDLIEQNSNQRKDHEAAINAIIADMEALKQIFNGVSTRDIQFESEFLEPFLNDLAKIDLTEQTIFTEKNKDLQNDIETLEEKLNDTRKGYEELSGINAKIKVDLNLMQEQKAAGDRRIEELTDEIQRYKTQGEEQQHQIRVLQDQISQLQRQNNQNSNFRGSIQALQRQNDEYSNALKSTEWFINKFNTYKGIMNEFQGITTAQKIDMGRLSNATNMMERAGINVPDYYMEAPFKVARMHMQQMQSEMLKLKPPSISFTNGNFNSQRAPNSVPVPPPPPRRSPLATPRENSPYSAGGHSPYSP